MIALLASGIVVGAIFQLMSGQGRFVERQSAREEVQQNTRAALELIGGELRTLPAGDALVRAAADSITLRAPRVWGVVCGVPGATTLDIVVPALAGASYTVNGGTGLTVNLGTTDIPVWSNGVSVTSIGSAGSTCNGEALPAGVERRTIGLGSTPQGGGQSPVVGDVTYLYDQVSYRTGTSGNVPGVWIQRRIGDGGQYQPMAGPIRDGAAGLAFEYFDGVSANPLATPITNPATRATVTRVRLSVEAISRNSVAGHTESKADTVVVSLRNRF